VANSIPRARSPLFSLSLGPGLNPGGAGAVWSSSSSFFNAFQGCAEVDRKPARHARILGASPQRSHSGDHSFSPDVDLRQPAHSSALHWSVRLVGEFVRAIQGIGLLIQNRDQLNPMASSRRWVILQW